MCEGIDHGQDADLATIDQSVRDKVHAPAFIDPARSGWLGPWLARKLRPSLDPHLETLLAVQPIHPLGIHMPPLPTQQDRQPLIAITRTTHGEVPQQQPKRSWIRPKAAVSVGTPTPLSHLACPSLAGPELLLQMPHFDPSLRGPQSFFRSTSWSICLSSVRSATRDFSRRFSS